MHFILEFEGSPLHWHKQEDKIQNSGVTYKKISK